MSKILVISDIHLHRWSYGSNVSKEGFNSRLIDQMNYLLLVVDMAIKNGVKHVVCLGDLFHTHSTIHAEVLNVAARFVQTLRNNDISFHCLVGNHDMSSKDGHIHTLDWLYPYGRVIADPVQFEIDGRLIAAMPYTENKERLERFFHRKYGTPELILLHQGINLNDSIGSAWVINEIFTKDMVPETAKLVLTGHYHRPVDDGKIHIVGSPMEHNWSDCDDSKRGVILVDLETLAIERIENKFSPRFMKMKYGQTEDVFNKFVRVVGCPIRDVEEIREVYMKAGARSIEFEFLNTEENREVVPVFTSFEQIIQDYDKAVDGRRREVGRLLRDSTYETP